MIESRTCLLPMITPVSHVMVRLYHHYQAGHLPFAGGLLDQPKQFLESMEKLGAEYSRIRSEMIEQARKG